MADPTVSDDDSTFNLSWQALTNASSYSLYISTDANATNALEANWSSLEGSQIIDAIAEANYSLDPDGASSLYLALRATNTSGAITNLSPLYQLSSIDYVIDGSTWVKATDASGWPVRDGHTSAYFDDKIWVLGGNGNRNDVWHSTDGVSWIQATAAADWSGRYDHSGVVFNNRLWILGGHNSDIDNDVWYSENGAEWTEVTEAADWSERFHHSSVVLDNKIWVLGGFDGIHQDDVWYSEDGLDWIRATDDAEWMGRSNHSSVVFRDSLWVIGGWDGNEKLNDVWYSEDGSTWTRATETAEWSERYNHTSTVFGGKLWVIGGYDGDYQDDVWYSEDGVEWTQATIEMGWLGRDSHNSTIFQNQLWVIGGYNSISGSSNDVWYYQPTTINSFAFNNLDYDYLPAQNQTPTFTSASRTTSAENNLAAYSARADDPDDGTLAFTITGGADAELFSLDSSSGALSFLAAPDYEEPADSNTDNNYELALQVSDGSAEDALSLVVSVSNIADDLSDPTGLQASTSGGILSLSWQIVVDAESYRVYWDTSSGVGIEQYSDTLSADGNSVAISGLSDATTYYFVVTSVSDQGESFESDELRVLMNTSVDNSSPVFTSPNSATVLENTSGVFYTASASDADGDDFSFALSGGADATLFS